MKALTSQEIHHMLINDEAQLDSLVIQLMEKFERNIVLEHQSRPMVIRNLYFVAMQMLKERRKIYAEHEEESWRVTSDQMLADMASREKEGR
jgi:hypothetical protein